MRNLGAYWWPLGVQNGAKKSLKAKKNTPRSTSKPHRKKHPKISPKSSRKVTPTWVILGHFLKTKWQWTKKACIRSNLSIPWAKPRFALFSRTQKTAQTPLQQHLFSHSKKTSKKHSQKLTLGTPWAPFWPLWAPFWLNKNHV